MVPIMIRRLLQTKEWIISESNSSRNSLDNLSFQNSASNLKKIML